MHIKLQAGVCNFSKSNIRPWSFFTFLKLYLWYQIRQSIRDILKNSIKEKASANAMMKNKTSPTEPPFYKKCRCRIVLLQKRSFFG